MSHARGGDKLWGGLPFCVSDRHTERQIDRETVSQTHRKANRQTDRVSLRAISYERYRVSYRRIVQTAYRYGGHTATERQIDRQTAYRYDAVCPPIDRRTDTVCPSIATMGTIAIRGLYDGRLRWADTLRLYVCLSIDAVCLSICLSVCLRWADTLRRSDAVCLS